MFYKNPRQAINKKGEVVYTVEVEFDSLDKAINWQKHMVYELQQYRKTCKTGKGK